MLRAARSLGFPALRSAAAPAAARRAAPMLARASSSSPTEGHYPGGQTVPFVSEPKMTVPSDYGTIPAYRIMDEDGSWRDEAPERSTGYAQGVRPHARGRRLVAPSHAAAGTAREMMQVHGMSLKQEFHYEFTRLKA